MRWEVNNEQVKRLAGGKLVLANGIRDDIFFGGIVRVAILFSAERGEAMSKQNNIEDADVVVDFRGGKDVAAKYRKRIQQLQAELGTAKLNTQIYCTASTCQHNDRLQGMCAAKTVHMQGCSPDADNVFGCSEFED